MDSLPVWLLAVLVVLAVVAGLVVGHRAGQFVPADDGDGKKSLASRAREAATRGVVSLWRWNRERKKKSR
jgi:hypothetical protein